jgi:3,4-dihydroxyphthalate decarboxylase
VSGHVKRIKARQVHLGADHLLREDLAALRSKVALSCRILGNAGLADFLGHVSARVPRTDRVLIRARGSEAGSMLATTAREILEVTLEGEPARKEEGLRPPMETPIHTRIYRARNDVGSVVHVHAPAPVLFSLVNLPILPVFNQGMELAGEGIPLYPKNSLVTTSRAGDELAASLGRRSSCLMFAHGVVTVGRTVEEATVRALRLETIAKMNFYARLLGKPRVIPPRDRAVSKAVLDGEVRGEWSYQVEMLGSERRSRRGGGLL